MTTLTFHLLITGIIIRQEQLRQGLEAVKYVANYDYLYFIFRQNHNN